MRVEYWPHRGTFEKSKKEHKEFSSLFEALAYVIFTTNIVTSPPIFSIEDIYIKHYCFDTRLQNECFMLCVGKYGLEDYIKQYGHPMCHGYLYFEAFKTTEDDISTLEPTGRHNKIKSLFYGHEKMSPLQLKKFLIEKCDISQNDIEIFDEYCRIINKKRE